MKFTVVNFPQYGEKDDIATISIEEDDLKEIHGMDARINEQIKAHFDALEKNSPQRKTEYTSRREIR